MTIETFESEFAEALTTIASGLGIAAERIFGTFVSAQVLIGIIDVASVFLTLFGALFLGWYARKLCMKWWKDDDGEWGNDDKEAAGIWVPCTVAVIVAAVISMSVAIVAPAMLKICCPEYSAMREIIALVIP